MAEASINLAGVIPPFLDQQFFDKVVRHSEKDANAKVSAFDIKPAMKPGENFASAVFRVSITFRSKYSKEDKTISVIVKTKPVLGPEMADYAAMIENSPFFRNEMAMYGKVLPDMQALLLSAGDKEVFAPK
jgi:Ecdysteroid kinase-like family